MGWNSLLIERKSRRGKGGFFVNFGSPSFFRYECCKSQSIVLRYFRVVVKQTPGARKLTFFDELFAGNFHASKDAHDDLFHSFTKVRHGMREKGGV